MTRTIPVLFRLPMSGEMIVADAQVSSWNHVVNSDVCSESTPFDGYVGNVSQLIDTLKKQGGKAVIARQICGEFHRFDADDMSQRYFEAFPSMFCFMFDDPVYGSWMAASPELVLEVLPDGHGLTRALAGTRMAGTQGVWDEKNVKEHAFVADDIVGRIDSIDGVEAVVGEPYNFQYGKIEHLCTPIELIANNGEFPVDEIVAALHPTAAVGGYPREKALELINKYEWWPRNLYGGLVKITHKNHIYVYAILRCVNFNDRRWAVYTGSGITADSIAADEWNETQAKAQPLLDLLNAF